MTDGGEPTSDFDAVEAAILKIGASGNQDGNRTFDADAPQHPAAAGPARRGAR